MPKTGAASSVGPGSRDSVRLLSCRPSPRHLGSCRSRGIAASRPQIGRPLATIEFSRLGIRQVRKYLEDGNPSRGWSRPNFMKAAPVVRALNACEQVRQTLVHTGQHYDFNMSDVFFQELGLPAPDTTWKSGRAATLNKPARSFLNLRPSFWTATRLCGGLWDVNSTVAAALVMRQANGPGSAR